MEESSDKNRYLQERRPPRIYVPNEFAVEIELEFPDGTRRAARCINLHISGVLVEFAPENIPDVYLGSNVFITIQLDSEIATKVPSTVKHVVGRRLGLVFPDLSTHASEEEDRLSRIVRNVEREVLRKKNQE